jgi:hypothetical protein
MGDGSGKVVVNLATGHEDADRVTVAFLVATAAAERGRPGVIFTTKEAVRLGLPGYAQAIVSGARPAGATPLWDWIGDGAATVFSYQDATVVWRRALPTARPDYCRTAQGSSWMRIRVPAGSRKAQSRTPYG